MESLKGAVRLSSSHAVATKQSFKTRAIHCSSVFFYISRIFAVFTVLMRFKAIFFIAVFFKQLFDFILHRKTFGTQILRLADFTSPPFKTARTASIPHEDISFSSSSYSRNSSVNLFTNLLRSSLGFGAPFFHFCFCRSVNFFTVSHLYHHTKYCRLYLISANHLYYMMCWRHSCFRLYSYTYRVCCQICLNRQRCKFRLNSSALKFRLCI